MLMKSNICESSTWNADEGGFLFAQKKSTRKEMYADFTAAHYVESWVLFPSVNREIINPCRQLGVISRYRQNIKRNGSNRSKASRKDVSWYFFQGESCHMGTWWPSCNLPNPLSTTIDSIASQFQFNLHAASINHFLMEMVYFHYK